MGKMTDDILAGVFCQQCGQSIGDAVGYPRTCDDCKPKKRGPRKHSRKKPSIKRVR